MHKWRYHPLIKIILTAENLKDLASWKPKALSLRKESNKINAGMILSHEL